MKHLFDVENIKCGGCVNTIETRLGKLSGVTDVQVDVQQGHITVTADDDSRAALAATLLQSGYPEKGTAEGIEATKARAKSFVSCAIGKLG